MYVLLILLKIFFLSCILCQGSQRPQPGLRIPEGIIAFSTVVLTDMIYYSQRIQGKINKGRGSWDEVWRKSGTSFQAFSPRSHTGYVWFLQQHVIEKHVKCHPPGKLIRDFMPRVLIDAGHVDFVFLTSTEILDSQEENRYPPQTVLFTPTV